ncbi:uncharacterized protein LOC141608820 [Silene latifolia]|uniref:uncharacterized protein LOC141608820 n=1 Tax=Silene latifolia TaxID=37657 RepID=UPI003D776AD2
MLFGEIPASLGKLSNLKELALSANNLSSIASSLRFPSNLESVDLSYNQLSGKIPTLVEKLSKLRILDISYNPLEGTVLSEHHFTNLSSLTYVYMDHTMLTLNLSSDWVPPFQLECLFADNCKINGQLPPWLQTQKNLTYLKLSNANISGVMPSWFHTIQQLNIVDLSNNKLSGSPIFPIHFFTINLSNNTFSGLLSLSNSSKTEIYRQANYIYLQNNLIAGPLPKRLGNLMPNIRNLILANNQIEGLIPNSLCQSTTLINLDLQDNSLTWLNPNWWGLGQIFPNLQRLSLSNNQIKSRIPDSLCQLPSLSVLDIKNNSLSGVIPNCLANMSSLLFVGLSYNKLTGHIPFFNTRDCNKSQSSEVNYLHLNDNMLSGEIPSCLSGFTNLQVLDLGGNRLSAKMLKWFSAENFEKLEILRLRGNKFSGPIPTLICSLPNLQLLDL